MNECGRPQPNFVFVTGETQPLQLSAGDRRYIVLDRDGAPVRAPAAATPKALITPDRPPVLRADLQAAQLIGEGRDTTIDTPAPAGPGWMGSRAWWFACGMAWGAALMIVGINLGMGR